MLEIILRTVFISSGSFSPPDRYREPIDEEQKGIPHNASLGGKAGIHLNYVDVRDESD